MPPRTAPRLSPLQVWMLRHRTALRVAAAGGLLLDLVVAFLRITSGENALTVLGSLLSASGFVSILTTVSALERGTAGGSPPPP